MGDFLFAQVKSVARTEIETLRVFPRGNVAKGALRENRSEFLDIEVIKYQLETNELITIESMGHGVPVVLLLVALDSHRIFFACLNDYIDKVIIPSDPAYTDKGSKVIYIPVKNEITGRPYQIESLQFLARRQQFYAAFGLFEYQRNELSYLWEQAFIQNGVGPNLAAMTRHFARLLDRLDIWEGSEIWAIVGDLRTLLDRLSAELAGDETLGYPMGLSQEIWNRLVSLSHNYEELCREWWLPTHLAQYLSYPDMPAVEEPDA